MTVRIKATNARGMPVGESHWNCHYTDAVVAEVRAMRAAGATYATIHAVLGVPHETASCWVIGARRKPAARYVVRRVKSSGRLQTNREPHSETPPPYAGDTVKLTERASS